MRQFKVFIDIDQTLSSGRVFDHLQESVLYYRGLGIAVPETVTCYPDLFQLPDVLCLHDMLPGAKAGVEQLAQLGELAYATVRAPDVEAITKAWLASQGFPSPDQVLMCQSMAHKLLALSAFSGPLILVDDRWRKALEVWPRLVDHDSEMAQDLAARLTLVAFGANESELPSSPVVPLLALPNWSRVDAVIQHFTIENDVVVH